ncbi:MAG TPA: hypothetical protein VF981_04925 [Gemmatimonadaceae bacterium]
MTADGLGLIAVRVGRRSSATQRTREPHRIGRELGVIAMHLVANPKGVLAQARCHLRPLPALLPVLTDPGGWTRELRHVTAFRDALSAAERNAVYCDPAVAGLDDRVRGAVLARTRS